MGIIKIKEILKINMGLKEGGIHDPFLLNISKPKKYIPKDTEIEFQINGKSMMLEWREGSEKKTHQLPKCFIVVINNYLKKPLPIHL